MIADDDDMPSKTVGNRMYCGLSPVALREEHVNSLTFSAAPESYTNYPAQKRQRPKISYKVDIWALGAVFSDVFVWSIAGERGREDYRCARKKEIELLPYLRSHRSDACFHDGTRRLASVEEQHKLFLSHRRLSDKVSPAISKFILSYMLTGQNGRPDAMVLRTHMDKHILEAFQEDPAELKPLPRSRTMPQPVSVDPKSEETSLQVLKSKSGSSQLYLATGTSQLESKDSLISDTSGFTTQPPDQQKLVGCKIPPIGRGRTPSPTNHVIRSQQKGKVQAPEAPSPPVLVEEVYEKLTKSKKMRWSDSFNGKSPTKRDEVMELSGMQNALSKITASGRSRDQVSAILDICVLMFASG